MPQHNNIHDQAVVKRHLQLLGQQDPRLLPILQQAGAIPARIHPAGFEGLARVICGQQLSVASANAIWQRLQASGASKPQAYLDLGADGLRDVGLSRSKFNTMQTIAQAVLAGELDLHAVADLPVDDAIAALTRYKGIGPWTAEIYLMFCAGHPDVFPAGDLALRKGVASALGLDDAPDIKALSKIAQGWAPYRSVAALLFWRYYGLLNKRTVIPV